MSFFIKKRLLDTVATSENIPLTTIEVVEALIDESGGDRETPTLEEVVDSGNISPTQIQLGTLDLQGTLKFMTGNGVGSGTIFGPSTTTDDIEYYLPESGGLFRLKDDPNFGENIRIGNDSINANIRIDNLNGAYTYEFPDKGGTLALIDDVSSAPSLNSVLSTGNTASNSITLLDGSSINYKFEIVPASRKIGYYDLQNGGRTIITFPDGYSSHDDITIPTGSGTLAFTSDIVTLDYLTYTAVLDQTGTGNPVATILGTPTFTDGITFTRTGAGAYTVSTTSGAFTTNKTVVLFGPPQGNVIYKARSFTDSGFAINTYSLDSSSQVDDLLTKTFIEIRVYH